jgi:hypothetical protein
VDDDTPQDGALGLPGDLKAKGCSMTVAAIRLAAQFFAAT